MNCLKYCTINKRIKGHVGGIEGVKHHTVLPIKDQRLCMSKVSKVVFVALYRVILLMSEVLKVVFVALYRVILLMSEVSKVHRELSIQSNVIQVKVAQCTL